MPILLYLKLFFTGSNALLYKHVADIRETDKTNKFEISKSEINKSLFADALRVTQRIIRANQFNNLGNLSSPRAYISRGSDRTAPSVHVHIWEYTICEREHLEVYHLCTCTDRIRFCTVGSVLSANVQI